MSRGVYPERRSRGIGCFSSVIGSRFLAARRPSQAPVDTGLMFGKKIADTSKNKGSPFSQRPPIESRLAGNEGSPYLKDSSAAQPDAGGSPFGRRCRSFLAARLGHQKRSHCCRRSRLHARSLSDPLIWGVGSQNSKMYPLFVISKTPNRMGNFLASNLHAVLGCFLILVLASSVATVLGTSPEKSPSHSLASSQTVFSTFLVDDLDDHSAPYPPSALLTCKTLLLSPAFPEPSPCFARIILILGTLFTAGQATRGSYFPRLCAHAKLTSN